MRNYITIFALITSNYFHLNSQTWNTFNTSYGYIQLGPANGQWAHIYSDRPKFIFNKDVYSVTGGFSSYDMGSLYLKTNGSTRMTITSNGKIGIGTTAPSEALQVIGSIKASNSFILENEKKLIFGDPYSSLGALTITHSAQYKNNYIDIIKGNLYFRNKTDINGNGTTLAIQSNGTVTIGVFEKYDNSVAETQGHKLMVNGGILCEKLKVIADVPNSDHVFEPDYKLSSLYELKRYILLHKHLPEVPSAQEFKENGYNVGEMDDLLLRKVEELTLYVIQLQEEIAELRNK